MTNPILPHVLGLLDACAGLLEIVMHSQKGVERDHTATLRDWVLVAARELRRIQDS